MSTSPTATTSRSLEAVNQNDAFFRIDQQGRALRRSCDRCHSQKLKCSRDGDSYAACVRCRRARQRCVYSARSARQTSSKGSEGGTASSANESSELSDMQQSQDLLAHENHKTLCAFDGGFLDTSSMNLPDITHDDFASFMDWGTTSYQMSDQATSQSSETRAERPDIQYLQESKDSSARSHQQLLLETLSVILKDLERALESMTTTWAGRDMQEYPVGHVFGIFTKLLKGFEPPPLDPHSQQAQNGVSAVGLEGHLRTKTTLLVVQCYVLCVNIMSALAEKLWQDLSSSMHLASLNGGEALQLSQNRRDEHVPGSFAQQMFSSMSVQSVAAASAASSGGSSSINSPGSFDEDLQICESTAQFDVFGHALSSACVTLRTGSRLLREIELMIGLPREHGIAAKGLPVGPLPYTSQIGCATGRATDPPSPCIYIDSSCVARLIVVLWDEQGQRFGSASDGPGDGSEKALTVLRRCYVDILGLYKRHLSHYEIV